MDTVLSRQSVSKKTNKTKQKKQYLTNKSQISFHIYSKMNLYSVHGTIEHTQTQIKVNHFCFSGRRAALSGRVEGTLVGFCLVRV